MNGPTLRIVAINDVYLLDNLPRLRSLVKHHATHAPADVFLVTLAGDFLAPSVLSSLDAGRGMVDCLNQIPITHAVLGNHEDDVETSELHARLREFRATVLLTNVRGLDDTKPKRQILTIGREGGRRVEVGLIGVLDGDPTLYRRPPFEGATIENANQVAMREATELKARGCVCTIPLTHQRMPDDRALAMAQRDPHFPVIIGGHEHQAILDQVDGTWIVKAGADAAEAVVIDFVWDDDDAPTVHVRLEAVANYPEDAALRARVDRHMEVVRELESATLVMLPPEGDHGPHGETLSSIGTRLQQTTMGTMLCSRVRDALGAEACLFNGGGIRGARTYKGRLTYGDLKSEVPFENEVVVVNVPGRVVSDAVAASRSNLPAESGGFLQIDDRMVFDDGSKAVTTIDGAPIDLARDYRIAVVRNLFEGMDKVQPLIDFAKSHPDRIPMPTSGRDVKLVLVTAFSKMLWEQLGGFDAIDTDHDGQVTAPELVAAIARISAEPPSEVAASVLMNALDTDKDGRITRQSSAPHKVK